MDAWLERAFGALGGGKLGGGEGVGEGKDGVMVEVGRIALDGIWARDGLEKTEGEYYFLQSYCSFHCVHWY